MRATPGRSMARSMVAAITKKAEQPCSGFVENFPETPISGKLLPNLEMVVPHLKLLFLTIDPAMDRPGVARAHHSGR